MEWLRCGIYIYIYISKEQEAEAEAKVSMLSIMYIVRVTSDWHEQERE